MLKRLISLAVALLIGLGPSLVVATDTIGSATKKGTVHGAVKRALGSSIQELYAADYGTGKASCWAGNRLCMAWGAGLSAAYQEHNGRPRYLGSYTPLDNNTGELLLAGADVDLYWYASPALDVRLTTSLGPSLRSSYHKSTGGTPSGGYASYESGELGDDRFRIENLYARYALNDNVLLLGGWRTSGMTTDTRLGASNNLLPRWQEYLEYTGVELGGRYQNNGFSAGLSVLDPTDANKAGVHNSRDAKSLSKSHVRNLIADIGYAGQSGKLAYHVNAKGMMYAEDITYYDNTATYHPRENNHHVYAYEAGFSSGKLDGSYKQVRFAKGNSKQGDGSTKSSTWHLMDMGYTAGKLKGGVFYDKATGKKFINVSFDSYGVTGAYRLNHWASLDAMVKYDSRRGNGTTTATAKDAITTALGVSVVSGNEPLPRRQGAAVHAALARVFESSIQELYAADYGTGKASCWAGNRLCMAWGAGLSAAYQNHNGLPRYLSAHVNRDKNTGELLLAGADVDLYWYASPALDVRLTTSLGPSLRSGFYKTTDYNPSGGYANYDDGELGDDRFRIENLYARYALNDKVLLLGGWRTSGMTTDTHLGASNNLLPRWQDYLEYTGVELGARYQNNGFSAGLSVLDPTDANRDGVSNSREAKSLSKAHVRNLIADIGYAGQSGKLAYHVNAKGMMYAEDLTHYLALASQNTNPSVVPHENNHHVYAYEAGFASGKLDGSYKQVRFAKGNSKLGDGSTKSSTWHLMDMGYTAGKLKGGVFYDKATGKKFSNASLDSYGVTGAYRLNDWASLDAMVKYDARRGDGATATTAKDAITTALGVSLVSGNEPLPRRQGAAVHAALARVFESSIQELYAADYGTGKASCWAGDRLCMAWGAGLSAAYQEHNGNPSYLAAYINNDHNTGELLLAGADVDLYWYASPALDVRLTTSLGPSLRSGFYKITSLNPSGGYANYDDGELGDDRFRIENLYARYALNDKVLLLGGWRTSGMTTDTHLGASNNLLPRWQDYLEYTGVELGARYQNNGFSAGLSVLDPTDANRDGVSNSREAKSLSKAHVRNLIADIGYAGQSGKLAYHVNAKGMMYAEDLTHYLALAAVSTNPTYHPHENNHHVYAYEAGFASGKLDGSYKQVRFAKGNSKLGDGSTKSSTWHLMDMGYTAGKLKGGVFYDKATGKKFYNASLDSYGVTGAYRLNHWASLDAMVKYDARRTPYATHTSGTAKDAITTALGVSVRSVGRRH